MSVIVKRTTWHDRLLWDTWRAPMPYLFHRWDAVAEPDENLHLTGFCHGFWKHSSARRYADFCNQPHDWGPCA